MPFGVCCGLLRTAEIYYSLLDLDWIVDAPPSPLVVLVLKYGTCIAAVMLKSEDLDAT